VEVRKVNWTLLCDRAGEALSDFSEGVTSFRTLRKEVRSKTARQEVYALEQYPVVKARKLARAALRRRGVIVTV